ncbi:MAG: MFS transporter, partial [Lapillicoccus sp.]
VPQSPLKYLFRYHWKGVVRVMFAAFIAMINTLYTVFALTFATSATYGNGFSSTFMLWIAIVANLIAIAIIPFWANLSDRVGRKPIFVTGAIGSAILAVAYLAAIASKNSVLVWTVGLLLAGVVYSMTNAVWPATYAEYFPTNVRLSGMAIGTQFGFGLAGFTPAIAAALAGSGSDGWSRVAIFAAVACAISAIAVATGPKGTHLVPTTELGRSAGSAPRTVETADGVRTS